MFAGEAVARSAELGYLVGDEVHTWSLGEPQDRDLARVRFYNSECGQAYVTRASEAAYRPSALGLMDGLTDVCLALQELFDARIAESAASSMALPHMAEQTESARFLRGLSSETSDAAISDACALDEDHPTRVATALADAARLKGSDPAAEKARLNKVASAWEVVAKHAETLARVVSPHAVGNLAADQSKARALREAATLASGRNFDDEPLPGVGSETWRAMWEAARAYSVSEAYHDHGFPEVGAGAVCVLCQQALTEDAADRLKRFEAFLTDTTSKQAAEAEELLAEAREGLIRAIGRPHPFVTALSDLAHAGEDFAAIVSWIEEAEAVGQLAINWLASGLGPSPSGIDDRVSSRIRETVAQRRMSAATIDEVAFAAMRAEADAEVDELQARSRLAEVGPQLRLEVARLKETARLKKARRAVDTTAITRKKTELNEAYVTAEVQARFAAEAKTLRLRNVALQRARGRAAATLEHAVALEGAVQRLQIERVLSEGEQTVLGLAGFLTEVELDDSRSGVIFDDPVSSLDAGRRTRVAKRFAELARTRQVVVFTHEITFVHALQKAARDANVSVTDRSVQRRGESDPGVVSDNHPWKVRDVKARIHELTADHARLVRDRDQLNDDDYALLAGNWCGRLSETWERAVSVHIVNELMDRGSNEVHVTMLKILPQFTSVDFEGFQNGYYTMSGWATRHDNAPDENFEAPDVELLAAELERFVVWFQRVSRYRDAKVS